jgi:hypothetical protein
VLRITRLRSGAGDHDDEVAAEGLRLLAFLAPEVGERRVEWPP